MSHRRARPGSVPDRFTNSSMELSRERRRPAPSASSFTPPGQYSSRESSEIRLSYPRPHAASECSRHGGAGAASRARRGAYVDVTIVAGAANLRTLIVRCDCTAGPRDRRAGSSLPLRKHSARGEIRYRVRRLDRSQQAIREPHQGDWRPARRCTLSDREWLRTSPLPRAHGLAVPSPWRDLVAAERGA